MSDPEKWVDLNETGTTSIKMTMEPMCFGGLGQNSNGFMKNPPVCKSIRIVRHSRYWNGQRHASIIVMGRRNTMGEVNRTVGEIWRAITEEELERIGKEMMTNDEYEDRFDWAIDCGAGE